MATRTVVEPGAWAQVAADVSALTWLQVSRETQPLDGPPLVVEFVAAAEAPAADAVGKQLAAGDTAISTTLPEIGTSGALYGRSRNFTAYVISE